MAYIIQHRRDTLENWTKVNPILADAEMGFILDLGEVWVDDVREVWVQAKDNEGNLLFDNEGNPIKVQKFDEDGKPMLEQILDEEGNPIKVKKIIQKSSFYKIGDGKTAWNDLPLFGFGGNFYDNFEGDDLDVSVASRRAILERLTNIIEGTEETEGLLDKLSNTQLVHFISPDDGETEDDMVIKPVDPENPDAAEVLTPEQVQEILKKQIVSRWALLVEFQQIWDDFARLEDNYINVINGDLQTLKDFAETFGEFKTAAEEDILQIQTDLEECRKYVFGWDEETENPEGGDPIIVHHNGISEVIDEKIAEVNDSISTLSQTVENMNNKFTNKHQIMEQTAFDNIYDFSQYDEGTIFYTYLEEEEEN